ncbi:fluoride efflux transporter CrcB [Bacillus pseudomycoides]|uniref:fluoride efflux transporter CrcB n=1 Tax=Bacillus pseudomycoides TaxID=64104 RepID=UPI000BECD003|nr:fluoride efflux transporter CrcB [Bacillus pseudomycoides]PED09910.1 fluoride efflux transporter CrcB [Bacillus pseudomycoides]PEI99082.1 fluoride efflux transporter CrcB [Bacillus pseudomycoides]PEK21108.1 fluoride efflux transporter CrcB [Bacillus pseudomycoides]PEM72804.1 fluoride efflux transporter CrcB [Bacillus pseudomycoides]PEO22340.1 fluoride efflux transporter CrcB [Bacillus pseudomycoides]
MNILLVGIGGFFGAIARFSISNAMKEKYGSLFPYGTLFVNILGSFLLGLLYGAEVSSTWLLLCGTGFMGAFTTFSTFKLEIIQLIHKREGQRAVLYLIMSYMFGIFSAFLGFYIGHI